MFTVLIMEVVVINIYMAMWFFIAQALRRNDIADIAWGLGFIVTAISAMIFSDSTTTRGFLVLFLVVLWGMRLACHIFLRNRGKTEDARYRKWRQQWGKQAVIRAL